MGKHDDHEAKTSGDGQVPKGTVIPPAPHPEKGRHGKDPGDDGDKDDGKDKK